MDLSHQPVGLWQMACQLDCAAHKLRQAGGLHVHEVARTAEEVNSTYPHLDLLEWVLHMQKSSRQKKAAESTILAVGSSRMVTSTVWNVHQAETSPSNHRAGLVKQGHMITGESAKVSHRDQITNFSSLLGLQP